MKRVANELNTQSGFYAQSWDIVNHFMEHHIFAHIYK